jgi:hypothetical protein
MSWSLEWSVVAERDLLNIPWRIAARVDAAVMAFAAGRAHGGIVECMTSSDPYRLRLRLRDATALLWIEHQTRTVHVSRVLRLTGHTSQ